MTIHQPPADIELEPHDWYLANWRNLPPLPKGSPQPFDRDACLKRLAKLKLHKSGTWPWSQAQIPQWMDHEQSIFWLRVLLHSDKAETPAKLIETLPKCLPIERETIAKRAVKCDKGCSPELLVCLAAAFDSKTLVEILTETTTLKGANHQQRRRFAEVMLPPFRRFVRPYLSDSERAEMNKILANSIDTLRNANEAVPVLTVGLAASLGLSEHVKKLLNEPWSAIDATWGSERVFQLLGLASADDVAQFVNQKLYFDVSSEAIRGVIAHCEDKALPLVRRLLTHEGNRDQIVRLVGELSRIHRASIAPEMMRYRLDSRGSAAGQSWLDNNPELALAGLMPVIEDEALHSGILDLLRHFIRTDKRDLVERHLDTLEPSLAKKIRQALKTTVAGLSVEVGGVPSWFPQLPMPKLPKWLEVTALPAILCEGQPLPTSCISVILGQLRESTLAEPRSLIALLKQHAEPRSLDAFVIAVFDRWCSANGKADEKWALFALGLLGGDRACLRLEEQMRTWPPQSLYQRVEWGAECLRKINSDQAFASIASIRCPQTHNAFCRMVAERRLSPEQIDDCIIPQLAQPGESRLEFGSRGFELTLSPKLEPCLLDDRRERQMSFPELHEADDPVKYDLAKGEWDLFRRRVEEILPAQRARLELAMRCQRRWRGDFFERVIVRHSLMGHLGRAIVWGIFDQGDKLRLPFRVTHSSCLDLAGDPVSVDKTTQIGIVHAAHLGDEERMIWGDLWTDLDLVPPFRQLNRNVERLLDHELHENALRRFEGRRLQHQPFAELLRARGWQQASFYDLRIFKTFPESRQYALIGFSNQVSVLWPQYGEQTPNLSQCGVFSIPNNRTNTPAERYRLTLSQATPMVVDELIRVILDAPVVEEEPKK
jgi:hypothetical protein